jgi:hypothetical protein
LNCYLSTALSTGRGIRTDKFSRTTLFIGYTTLKARVYLAGFTMNNGDGLINYLKATATIPSNTNIINY